MIFEMYSIYEITNSGADMLKNCGFFHKSMKFGIPLDNGLSNIFSYGGIPRNVSIRFENIF